MTINKYLLKQAALGFAVMVLIFVLGYMFLFRPVVSYLQEQTYENYRLLAKQKEMSVEQFLSRSMEGAESLSSRTMIRDAIDDYHDGEITFEELISYTQPRYADGVNVLADVDASTRVVDGDIIAQVPVSADAVMVDDVQDVTTTEYKMIFQEENTFVVAISPIVLDGSIIGHDIVRFSMVDFFDDLNENNKECMIISLDERQALLNEVNMLIEENEYRVFKKNQDIIYLSDGLVNSDTVFLKVSTKVSVLESDLREIINRALFWDGVLFVASFALIFYLISRETSSRIKLANYQKEMYQEKANKDALTGVYTRHYLEEWSEKIKKDNVETRISLTVVMCDVNGFKQYNDNHGHEAGDKVLIDIGKIMTRYTDEDDVVIRYGGDEFLLVSKDDDQAYCEGVMHTINRALKQKHNLSFAYGVAVAKTVDELESAIDQADKEMYQSKINH